MVLISMEHTVHMFLMVLAIYFIHKNVESNFQTKDFIKLLTVVFFVSIVRFESMFFTASLAFAMFLRKDFAKGILVMVTGFSAMAVSYTHLDVYKRQALDTACGRLRWGWRWPRRGSTAGAGAPSSRPAGAIAPAESSGF